MLAMFLTRMESEDKRHIQRIYGRVSIALLLLTACRSQADATTVDGSSDASVPAPSVSAVADAAVALPPPRPSTIYGEWERRSPPYKGLRIALVEGESNARVTRSSTVDAAATNKAQLECQRSLWKPGDVIITGVTAGGGSVVVRDWGVTQGLCRHQETKARAAFIRADDDNLIVAVTRGKTTTNQEWSRVAALR
jgi:hypothetical protein